MGDYTIPCATDFPDIETDLADNPYPYGPFGAKGAGELFFNGAAAAYLTAVEHAMDITLSKLPVTPEVIMEACCHGN